jgi:23S rRNA (pseudouridine1915-N3)-methyltransferase
MTNVLEHHRNLGMRDFTFIFGGSHGLHPQVLARANMSWSLSLLTLPHRLAWLVLTEQLFRIHTLWQGSPYHHGNRLGEAT